MKKSLTLVLCFTLGALLGLSFVNKGVVSKAEGEHHLLFANHDFSSREDLAAYNNGEGNNKYPEYSNGITTFHFTKAQPYAAYRESIVGTHYMQATANKTYRYSLTFKTTEQLQVHLWCDGWTIVDDYASSSDWTTITFDVTPISNKSLDFSFQMPMDSASEGDLLIKNVYFGELRSFSKGDTVGELPEIPQKDTYTSSWTIDGEEISSSTVLDYDEDKIAHATYTSVRESFKVSFAEHDLVYDYSDSSTASNDNMSRQVVGNELVLGGITANNYFSKYYDFEAGKTYFVMCSYRNSQFSSFSLYLESPWTDIFVGKDSWDGYKDSYFEFVATSTIRTRLVVQCAWSGEGSDAGQRTVNQYMRDFYLGEVKTFNKNSPLGELPALPEKTGYVCDSWTINGDKIDATSYYTFGEDAVAYPNFVEDCYKIGFAETDYGDLVDKANSEDLTYSLFNGVLNLTSTQQVGPALWLKHVEVIKGHQYIVSVTFKKDRPETSLNVAEDNHSGVLTSCTSTEYETKVFEIEATTTYFHFYLQFAWWAEGSTSSNAQVESFYVADLTAGMSVKNGGTIGALPTPEDTSYTNYSWTIDGEKILEGDTFNYTSNKIAILETAKKFNVSFVINEAIVETRTYAYGDKIGEFPTFEPEAGYEYKWVIGDTNTEVDEDYRLNYEVDQIITLVKTPVTYYVTFVADNKTVDVVGFTVESTSIEEPEVPEKTGYEGSWETYTLGTENIVVNAVYTPIQYYVTFMADGVEVAKIGFTVETESITAPTVPAKEGYAGTWEAYTLGASDITVNAVYTPKQYLAYFRVNEDSEAIYLVRITYGQKLSTVMSSLPEIPEEEGKIGKWVIGDTEITLDTVWTYAADTNILVKYEDDPNYVPPKTSSKGCGGSIIGTSSLVCLGAISLLTFIGIKKKYE